MSRPDDFSDTDLSAWLDGELEADTRARVEAWLHDHPEAAARTRLWAADRDALRARLDPVLGEPVPPALLNTAQRRRSPCVGPRPPPRRGCWWPAA
jgi:anti-sigma factor RsiW